MTKIIYFDPSCGVSGDMFTAALIDMGADFQKIKKDVDSLDLDIEIKAAKVDSHGITATKFTVIDKNTGHDADSPDNHHHHDHRHLSDIKEIINGSSMDEAVKSSGIAVFELIAEAEAAVHGADIESVHFHEVGALDSIADIVAAASAFHQLNQVVVYSGPINTGSGTVECQHGKLPVPAPAVLKLLNGMEAFSDGTKSELATPTGVALLKHFCNEFKNMPKMKIEASGSGMGTRDIGRPNLFRVIMGVQID